MIGNEKLALLMKISHVGSGTNISAQGTDMCNNG
jgi:hypothetical protein